MNILGISFGQKNHNDDILVKEALYGCREAAPDADIRFVNTVTMNIGRCRGCVACSRALEQGKDNDCIFKDDFQKLEDMVRWADCLIVGCPVYTLQPAGQFKDFVDRFSCRHDISAIPWVLDKRRSGELPGNADDFPMDRLRHRYVSYISVGGASTKNWVAMGAPSMPLFGISAGMKTICNYDAHHMGTTGNPYLDPELIERMHEIGRRTAGAYGKPYEEVEAYTPQGEGVCPVCHQNLLMLNGTTTVECPVCGIEGHLSVDGDKVNVEFSEDQINRARGTFRGLREHTTEIQSFGAICGPKIMANKEMIDKNMNERIKNFDKAIKSPGESTGK